MRKIHIVGNPNSGKTTLFNSLTKSSQHIGNWHGVTVDKASKIIDFGIKTKNQKQNSEDEKYEIIDLPGLYSLNAYSLEEQVSVDEILGDDCNNILYLIDANNFKRSMLLALNLLIKGKNIKILINNYKFFEKRGGKLDIEYLKKILGCEIEIINAQKIKPTINIFNFNTKTTAFITAIKNELNKISNTYSSNNKLAGIDNMTNNDNALSGRLIDISAEIQCKQITVLYNYISKISMQSVSKIDGKVYGYSKYDQLILKLSLFLPSFIILVGLIIYCTFFLIGPIISDLFVAVMTQIIQRPIMAIISLATNSRFVIALFNEGVFGACFSVLGFLPQICLMYLFLSILENSGLISRMAYMLDDTLQKIGLNGKIVYTLLMGFGCSTSASLTAKNMPDKNSKIKATLLAPFMSCSAKLPIYITVALAVFGVNGIWIIMGLYIVGIIVAISTAIILERTILPSPSNQFLIEFPPLKLPNYSNVIFNIKNSCTHFIAKIFSVIFGFSIVLWLLTNFNIHFQYVGDSSRSILYSFSVIISWMFKPMGLNNPNIICALLIGLVAKELILSSFAISNKITNLTMLAPSLIISSNPVNFTPSSAVAFLIFTLLYFPCVSNFAVLLKETGVKYTLLGILLQLGLAYTISCTIYQILTKGLAVGLVILLISLMLWLCIRTIYNLFKNKKMRIGCKHCNRCNNK